jgi:hypothetical protein
MSDFFPARGCVYRVQSSGNGTQGFYSFADLPTGGQGSSVVLLQGVDYNASDILQPIVTLEDMKVLYSFGSDFSQVVVFGEILLGPAGGNAGDAFNQVITFFQNNRTSVKKAPTTLSLPGSRTLNIYLQALNIGRVDPEYHVQPFAFTGICADNL